MVVDSNSSLVYITIRIVITRSLVIKSTWKVVVLTNKVRVAFFTRRSSKFNYLFECKIVFRIHKAFYEILDRRNDKESRILYCKIENIIK